MRYIILITLLLTMGLSGLQAQDDISGSWFDNFLNQILGLEDDGELPEQVDTICNLSIGADGINEYCWPSDQEFDSIDNWDCSSIGTMVECEPAGLSCFEEADGDKYCFNDLNGEVASVTNLSDLMIDSSCTIIADIDGITEYCWPVDSDMPEPDSSTADPALWSCGIADSGLQQCTPEGIICFEDADNTKICFDQATLIATLSLENYDSYRVDVNISLIIDGDGITEYLWPITSDIDEPSGSMADPEMWSCNVTDSGRQECVQPGIICLEEPDGRKDCYDQQALLDALNTSDGEAADAVSTGDAVAMSCTTVIGDGIGEYCWPEELGADVTDYQQFADDEWDCVISQSGMKQCTLEGYTCSTDSTGARVCMEQAGLFSNDPASRIAR